MTKFKARETLVPLLFLFLLIFILKANGTFFISVSLLLQWCHSFKIGYNWFILTHVSLTLSLYSCLCRVWISVSYLSNKSPLTNASISWAHESPANYRSKAFIKLFWNMTSTTLAHKIKHRVHTHACLFSSNMDFSVHLSPTLGSHYCPAHPNSVMYHLPAFV